MDSYESRIKLIKELDVENWEKEELLQDLRYEIEMDEEVSEMETKANLLKTIDLLMKII